MNSLNSAVSSIFNVVLAPFELLGVAWALILVSGIFGILALVGFKFISFQKGIKGAKDKIKGHMIEIRLYQDDLIIVGKAVFKVLARNLQYLTFNFGPFVPLAIPFVFVLAQLVTRYAFAPLPVQNVEVVESGQLAGAGTEITIEMAKGFESRAAELTLDLPDGVEAVSKLVRNGSEGVAFCEVVPTQAGVHEIAFVLPDGTRETKVLVAGEPIRIMQPERVKSFWSAALWPAEPTFPSDSPFARIAFTYPDASLGWLPGAGLGGVFLVFIVASMAFGVAVLKPLGIQI